MENINITRGGKVVSQVCFGTRVAEAGALLKGNIFVVYDPAVEKFAKALAAEGVIGMYAMKEVSEEGKTLEAVEDICRWLLESGADRDACLVAVGGGIVSDMVGFAAAIYKRGVRAVYVPTTLLAQVDAAIGGKTGVNLDAYKNILGVFKQPEVTFICPEVLETLPEPVFRAGLAEMLKTFIIDNGSCEGDCVGCVDGSGAGVGDGVGAGEGSCGAGESAGGRVERMMAVVQEISEAGGFAAASPAVRAEFGELVAEAAGVKAGVVTRDELESGERRKLNLGHTFAHAIEYVANSHTGVAESATGSAAGSAAESATESATESAASRCGGPEISHGEAVAIGMAMAARLSVALGVASAETEAAVLNALKTCGLPTECPFPLTSLLGAMTKDKKAEGGSIHFILIRSIGDVIIRDLTVTHVADLL